MTSKVAVWDISTEGDCGGLSRKNFGLFRGTISQVISYCLSTGKKPSYFYNAQEVDVIDASEIDPIVCASITDWDRVSYSSCSDESIRFERELIKNRALSKLSDEEMKVLGLI